MSAAPGESAAFAPRALAAAVGLSAAIVVASPLVGDLRQAVLTAFPRYYVMIIWAGTAAGAAALAALCLSRIRAHRALRYSALALALVVAAGAASVLRSGNANVDAVEAFHFVEYAAVTLCFYRAFRACPRWEAYGLAALAGILVGALDEWYQWFVPGRAGELHDVLFDAVAVGCGLLLCVALDPWDAPRGPRRAGAAATLAWCAAFVALVVSGFVAGVHMGYEIHDQDIGAFRSRFSASRLRELAGARAVAWGRAPLPAPGRFGREDQYLAEALWHVRRRNEALEAGRRGAREQFAAAWGENLILEGYFEPVLEARDGAGHPAYRLPDEQRASLVPAVSAGTPAFSSDANPFPIYTWRPVVFWPAAIAAAGALVLLGRYAERR